MKDSNIKRPRLRKKNWKASEEEAILAYIKDTVQKDLGTEKPSATKYYKEMINILDLGNVEIFQLQGRVKHLQKSYINAMEWQNQNGHDVGADFARYQLYAMCPHWNVLSEIFEKGMDNEAKIPSLLKKRKKIDVKSDKKLNETIETQQQTKKLRRILSKNDDPTKILTETNENFIISELEKAIPKRELMDCAIVSIDKLGTIICRCSICNEKLNGQESLIAHITNHFQDLFVCHICQQSCDSLEFLIEHVNLLHSHGVPNLDEKDPLDIADLKIENVDLNLTLVTETYLNNQGETISSLHDEDNDDVTLKDTNYEQTETKSDGNGFDSPDGTSSEIDHKESIKSWRSDEDSLKPTKALNLPNFEAVHNDSGQREYPCPICPTKYQARHRLKRHFLTIHLRYKRFQCEICGKQFIAESDLRKHASYMHKDGSEIEKNFECSECGKLFPEKGNLKQHMRTHTGERPFKCIVCGKSFAHSSYARMHVNVHTGERPYKCTICEAAFVFDRSRRKHELRHSNRRPYQCEVCGKPFLKKHMSKNCKHRVLKGS